MMNSFRLFNFVSLNKQITFQECRYCQHICQNFIYQYNQKKRHISGTATRLNEKVLSLHQNITLQELASKLKKKNKVLLDLLKEYGYNVDKGVDTVLDNDIAEAIADEFGYNILQQHKVKKIGSLGDKGILLPRPPVVTIMGHVDHGKTTLLDYLRNTQVAENEAGGITQSIAAFSVKVPGVKDSITFVDTPGHAAFNNMRARGAGVTDAVVLIIAADDGIMQQTVECIKHIKNADVPLIVAFNKIDKPNAKTDKIKKDLLTHGIHLEEFGGDIKSVAISALKGVNIDELLVLLNELTDGNPFVASYDAPAQVVVLETENNKQKGIISTVLVKQGQLSKGKVLLTDEGFAKIRQMFDANGKVMERANPSEPVQILGWRTLPRPGDVAVEVKNESEARNILKLQAQDQKPVKVVQQPLTKAPGKKGITQEFKSGRSKRIPYRITLRAEAASATPAEETGPKSVDIIIKADVSGSLEAIVNVLNRYHSPDLTLNIIHAAVGAVNENDLKMLQSSHDGIVYSFNVDVGKPVATKAEALNISIRQFDIIYKLLDDLKEEIEAKLPAIKDEYIIGEATVLKVFRLTGARKSVAAGCRVQDGFLDNSDKTFLWRVVRQEDTVFQGTLQSLKRGKEDIALAKKMTECGVTFDKFSDFQEGDKILCVRVDERQQTVDWNL